ncbi:efflux RND transporter periplasmic adaptor subunit [candidate division WOR-3 bacterium]|nr:efflux RND transporter periplasmic adaptor subunit [candidate division WOR-3 bacterium]
MPTKHRISSVVVFFILTLLVTLSCGEKAAKVELDKGMIGTEAICPVTGDEFTIHESTPVVKYKGEEYYMCCPGCDTEFMKDPEKYIMLMQQKERSMETETDEDSEVQYWTCSMHPEVKSDEEGNCPICGMSLIPVYEKDESDSALHLSAQAMELAGITMVPAKRLHVHKEIRAVGMVAYDPELVTAQEEYVNAMQLSETIGGDDEATQERTAQLIRRTEYKLRLLGMDDAEVRRLRNTRQPERSLIMPEGRNWIYADIYEPDIGWVKRGQDAIVTSSAYPGEEFSGRVVSINPILDSKTRSVNARIRLNDVEWRLKPGMFIEAKIIVPYEMRSSTGTSMAIAIPKDAVLDMGNRQIVWVAIGDGKFQPRVVKLGPEVYTHGDKTGARYYPVLEGLSENEMVVINGNFLIDSESNLTGVAAIGYGGALGVQEKEAAPVGHQH